MTAGAPAPERGLAMRSQVSGDGTVEVGLDDLEVPRPGPGQVIVRVEAAPINPSDVNAMFAGADLAQATRSPTAGRIALVAPLPSGAARAAASRIGQAVPVGNEGAGTVVATGSDASARALLGKLVAVAGGGMYAQYRCVEAAICLELPSGVGAAQGAASFVNPMTALGMVMTMRSEGHTALVNTAAASTLGQMLSRLCQADGIPLVNIVRSPAQRELLLAAGARHVCDSTSDTFTAELTQACKETKATIAFDAIGGGTLAARILHCMEAAIADGANLGPYGSSVLKQVYVYGGLDRGPTELVRDFGMTWSVGGWLLTPFLQQAGTEQVTEMRRRVAEGLTTIFASHFTDQLSLDEALAPEAAAAYGRPSTGTKFLITPEGPEKND